ncbi:MAG: hypothetical protein R3237_03315 [Nitrosopumilaceae archaeon]|nr:hypothetical protein [Nitrosopumilaceae archaeon]
MAKRITIMIDDEVDKKLRMIQAKQISKTNSSVSYSQVLNEQLRKSLK